MTKSAYLEYSYPYAQKWRDCLTNTKALLTLLLLTSLFISSNTFAQNAVIKGTVPINPPSVGLGIDGDLKANVPTAGIGDWLPNTAASGGILSATGAVPAGSTRTFHRIDSYSSGDNIFSGGLKKDGDLTKYTWKNGSPSPSKCDINNLLVHIGEATTGGDTWITLSGDRQSTNGNSFISIALLQKMLTDNSGGTFTSGAPSSTGGRTVGDVQISAEFTGGGVNPNLYLEEWRNVSGVYKWVSIPTPANSAFGSTNAAVLTGVPYDAFGTSSYDINAFIEVSFNISEIYRNTATACVGSIASMFVITKSSQAVNADLADFLSPLQINLNINVGLPTAAGATYCVGNTIQNLTATGEAGATFKWYTAVDADGKPTGNSTTGSSYNTGIDNTISGVYNYYVTQTLKGCEGQPTTVTVTVNPNATANAGTAPTAQCYDATNGSTFALSGSGSNGIASWAVQSKSPNTLTAVITNGNTYAPSVKVTGGTGTVTLRLTVTSPYTPSCGTPTSDVTVTVNPNATADAGSAPTAQCYDESGNTFSLSGTGTNGTPSWAVQSKSPNTLTAVITNGDTYTPSVKVAGGTGTVTLRLTVASNTTPACGNPTSDVTVTVNPLPTANADTDPASQCYVASGNTFNLTGTGANGTPSWTVQNKTNNALTVDITNGNTLSPSVKISGSTSGGTVTLRLTVTSNTTPTCGSKTDDIDLAVSAQVGGPDVEYVGPSCTETTFKVEVRSPQAGTYTIRQLAGGVAAFSKTFPTDKIVTTDYPGGIIRFEGLTIGKGYYVTFTVGSCTSAPNSCGTGDFFTVQQTPSTAQQSTITQEIELAPQTKVIAAPNPFNDRVRFSLKSSVSGQGSLELYNMLGQKVKTVFQGYVNAGQVQTIEYSVPGVQRSNLIYVFTVGKEKTTGKLINLKK